MQSEIIATGEGQPEALPPKPLNIDGLPMEYWELIDTLQNEKIALARKLTLAENRVAKLEGRPLPWPDWRKKGV